MKQYLTEIEERRSLLNRIIPQLALRADKRGLDWGTYFQTHPEHAILLGYDIREKDPNIWNANNVMGRQTVRDRLKGKLNGELPKAYASQPEVVEPNPTAEQAQIEDLRAIVRKLEKQLQAAKTMVKHCPECGFNIAVLNAAYRIALKHGGTDEA